MNLSFGDSATWYLSVYQAAAPSTPYDLTSSTVQGQVYRAGTSELVTSFAGTVTDAPNGKATLVLDTTHSAQIARGGSYELRFMVLTTGSQATVYKDTLSIT